jgi:hypothetical protein
MPRARPKDGWTGYIWGGGPFQLSEPQRDELLLLTGLDAEFDQINSAELLLLVERALGSHSRARAALDNVPRPANKRAFLAPLERKARALFEDVSKIQRHGVWWDLGIADAMLRHEVEGAAEGFAALAHDLRRLVNAAAFVREHFDDGAEFEGCTAAQGKEKQPESRGAPEQRARTELIRRLAHLFDFFARDVATDAHNKRVRPEFVAVALAAAGIPHPAVGSNKMVGRRRAGISAGHARLPRALGLMPVCQPCRNAHRGKGDPCKQTERDLYWVRGVIVDQPAVVAAILLLLRLSGAPEDVQRAACKRYAICASGEGAKLGANLRPRAPLLPEKT